MPKCEECKNPITDETDLALVEPRRIASMPWRPETMSSRAPVPKTFHKRCAPNSPQMREIIEKWRLINPIVSHIFSAKDASDMTYREMLEQMVVHLAAQNESLTDDLNKAYLYNPKPALMSLPDVLMENVSTTSVKSIYDDDSEKSLTKT